MRRSVLSVLVLWSVAAAAGARDGGLLEGELGEWLDAAAAELGETLARHPRFEGETIRLVTLSPGDPSGRTNRLAQAVERRLRERLLAIEGVRLAAEQPRRDCEPPPRIGYLLRTEVAPSGSREGRVHIAVVDVAESVWVSGISHQWQGPLRSAERAALRDPVAQGVPGTAGSPIPLQDAGAVAAALKAHLACSLPRDLDGPLYVAVPEPAALTRVGLALQSELMFEPLAAVTADRDEARWLLTFDGESAGADVRELALTLADADGGHRQRVAAVFVTGARAGARDPVPAADAAPPAVATAPARPALLSALEMRPARPEGICDNRRARINSCVEITFELLEPAYLFVLSTSEHAVIAGPCGGDVDRDEPGERRYRMRVPPGSYAVDPADTGPDAGFYVLAVQEREAARLLQEALSQAPGVCRGVADADPAAWLAALDRELERLGDRVDWRTLHVAHDTAGIVAL